MAQSSTRIEDSRDILKGMIFQEDNYYKCPNYLCLDDNSIQASVSMPVPSLLEIVEEMASLVTDVGNEPSVKTKGNYHCTSPGSSVCDIYGDFEGAQQISLPQPIHEEKSGKRQQCPPKRRLRHRPFQETLSFSSWRHRMLDWGYEVCVTFNIDSSVLEIAFNILDRYIALEISSDGTFGNLPLTREDFQLFSMVSIYIAIKIFNRNQTLELRDLIEMAQGYYTKIDITTTECDILEVLNWHVNPPKVIDYCDIYLTLFPQHQYKQCRKSTHSLASSGLPSNSMTEKRMLECKCKSMVDVVLDDVFFIDKVNSVIALAVVLLATDIFRGCGRDAFALQTFLRNIQGVVNIQKQEFDSIIQRLECSC
uniref:Cyclin N-terminal domain-containing protein n=1 Tax=Pseudo-nitzschia australis TaxID=44445 RepID=A0A7S4AXD1_9STRA|mmetsp:Transcript_7566/g.16339  ORF Transcript_7566/g.16339 Transcript_7566/m.16339 type:complete len:366 (+) Transcript_7566:81-1178(+)